MFNYCTIVGSETEAEAGEDIHFNCNHHCRRYTTFCLRSFVHNHFSSQSALKLALLADVILNTCPGKLLTNGGTGGNNVSVRAGVKLAMIILTPLALLRMLPYS